MEWPAWSRALISQRCLGSHKRLERVYGAAHGVGAWLANDIWGAIRGVGESIRTGLAGIGTWLSNDIWGAIRGVGEVYGLATDRTGYPTMSGEPYAASEKIYGMA